MIAPGFYIKSVNNMLNIHNLLCKSTNRVLHLLLLWCYYWETETSLPQLFFTAVLR